ncbi:MAG: ArnT family glycosyltransferase [Thermomicrobiales bacterium]
MRRQARESAHEAAEISVSDLAGSDAEDPSPDGEMSAGVWRFHGVRTELHDRLLALDWLSVSLVVVAMVVGGALRLYDIGNLPRGFNQDEAVYSYDAWSLSQSGRDHLGHPLNFIGIESYGDWTPPVQTSFLIPAARVFGLDVTALRAWNALIALMVIPLMYLLARTLFDNRHAALLAAWLIALSPWQIIQSRMIIPAAIVPVVVALLMIALTKSAKLQSARWIFAVALVASLGLATYQSLRGYVPMLLFAATVAWWRRYLKIGPGPLAMAALIFALFALPIYGFLLFDDAGSARMKEVSVFTENSLYLPEGTEVDAAFLAEQYLDYFGPGFLLEEGGEYYPWVLPRDVGAIPLALAIATAIGVALSMFRIVRPRDEWQRGVCLFLLLALLLYPIPGAISLPSPSAPRVMHGLPVFVLIATFGMLEMWRIVSSWSGAPSVRSRQIAMGAAGAALAVLLVVQSAQHMDAYFSRYAEETSFDFHYGIDGAIEFAVRNQSIYDEIWMAHVNEGYIYLLFHERIDPAEARQEMTLRRVPGAYNWVMAYENFRFTSRIWVDPPAALGVENMAAVFQTFYPNGEVAYEVRAGEVPDRGLVMVILKPQWLGR